MTINGPGRGLISSLLHKQIHTLFAFGVISVAAAGLVTIAANKPIESSTHTILVSHLGSSESKVLGEASVADNGYVETAAPFISGWSYNASTTSGAVVTIVVENANDSKISFTATAQPSAVRIDAAQWLRSIYGSQINVRQPLGFSIDPKTFISTSGNYRIRSVITNTGTKIELSKPAQAVFTVSLGEKKQSVATPANSTAQQNTSTILAPDGVTFPATTTQTALSWPQVAGAIGYQVFANDMSNPALITCQSGNFYFCSGTITTTTTNIQLTPGHTYQWWVKAISSSNTVLSEKGAFFSVTAPSDQLYIRVSRSVMAAGETYYLYAVTRPAGQGIVGYSGMLDAMTYTCQPANPSQCTQPGVVPWGNYTLSNGSVKVDLPPNFPTGIYKAKFRPRGSNAPWSNEIVVNVGTNAGLEDMTQYWKMPETETAFSGTNTATGQSFNAAIGYSPVTNCATQIGGQAKTMYFTKDKVDGYWTPKYPWSDLWQTAGDENLRWHLVPWQRKAGWHDEYLTAWGDERFVYNPSSLSSQGNFQTIRSAVRYGSIDPQFPGYVLSPHWAGIGYGMSNPSQKYNGVSGATANLCNTDFDPATQGDWAALWVVHIDKTVLHTADYDGPAMRIKFYEGDMAGWFIREDWYFVKNVGLVRIEQKSFGPTATAPAANPVAVCAQDPDCLNNEFMLKPHTAMNKGAAVVTPPAPITIKDGYVDTATNTAIVGWSYDSTAGNTGQPVTVVVENTTNSQSTFTKVVQPTITRTDAATYLRQQYNANLTINQPLGFSVDPNTFITTPGTYKIRSITTNGGYVISLSAVNQSTIVIGGTQLINKLDVKVDGALTTQLIPGGSYEVSANQIGSTTPYNGMLDVESVICNTAGQQCSAPSPAYAWGSYTLVNGKVTINLPQNFPVGLYKARFKPRNLTTWQWSEQISVLVDTAIQAGSGKANSHRFTGLRAGATPTANGGWNMQDFALHLVNTSTQNIDVTWKMIADNASFRFQDGSVGTRTVVLPIDAAGWQSINIAGAELNPFLIPVHTNFTGSTELSACARGSNPCVPVPFYAYLFAHTPATENADADLAWYKSWDEWHDQVPVSWDAQLNGWVVPYTNYWHNVGDWPKGWESKLTFTNSGSTPAVYTIKHVPDTYSHKASQAGICDFTPYTIQTASVTIPAGATQTINLRTIFGWSDTIASYMEGYLVITPSSNAVASASHITSEVVPSTPGASVCRANIVELKVKNPINNGTVSGTVPLTARVITARGTPVTAVKFSIDGQVVGSGTLSTFLAFDSVFNWNSGLASVGTHQLLIQAFNGNTPIGNPVTANFTVSRNEVTYNGNDPLVVFVGGGWTNYAGLAGAYNDDEIFTATNGASAKFTAPGAVTNIKLYAAKAYNRGKMEVYIDNISKGLIDPYDQGVQVGAMLFDSGPLTAGSHEIKIVNRSTDTTRPYIGLDKIVVTK